MEIRQLWQSQSFWTVHYKWIIKGTNWKFLKISQCKKHNKKYIYIYISESFRAQFRRWTRRSWLVLDSRFGRDPCPVPNERPIRKHSLVLSSMIPPPSLPSPPISASIFVYAYAIRPLCVMRLQVAAMQGEEVARRKRGARPTSGWVRHPAGPDTQGVGRKVLSFRVILIIVARK